MKLEILPGLLSFAFKMKAKKVLFSRRFCYFLTAFYWRNQAMWLRKRTLKYQLLFAFIIISFVAFISRRPPNFIHRMLCSLNSSQNFCPQKFTKPKLVRELKIRCFLLCFCVKYHLLTHSYLHFCFQISDFSQWHPKMNLEKNSCFAGSEENNWLPQNVQNTKV